MYHSFAPLWFSFISIHKCGFIIGFVRFRGRFLRFVAFIFVSAGCQSCSNWSHHCTPRMNNLDLCMWAVVVERWLSIILNWTSRAFFSNNKPFWEFVDSSQDWLSSMKWPKYDKKFFWKDYLELKFNRKFFLIKISFILFVHQTIRVD